MVLSAEMKVRLTMAIGDKARLHKMAKQLLVHCESDRLISFSSFTGNNKDREISTRI
jgi:uridine phosphorylase